MSSIILSGEIDFRRISSLAALSYRPRAIRLLKAEIEADILRLERYRASGGYVDDAMIFAVVRKKFQLDELYVLWMRGSIG